jgi:hypothetical protein
MSQIADKCEDCGDEAELRQTSDGVRLCPTCYEACCLEAIDEPEGKD